MCAYSRFARAASRIALTGGLSLASTIACAMDFLDGNFQVHGFASLTLVNTSDNNSDRVTTRSATIFRRSA